MTGSGERSPGGVTVPASVVVATFNRRASALRLLRQLAAQTLDPGEFEVVIVDDGSEEPVSEWLPGLALPYRVTAVRQANAGAAAARHRGILEARGELVVVTDDDMQLPPGFLAAHLERHAAGSRRVVVGRIRSSSRLPQMPLFERFHARLLDRWESRPRRGDFLYTGNMSLRRADYLAVGGFDSSFELAEDVDLGLRLEQAGVELVFSDEAYSTHESDRADFAAWRRRAASYGRCSLRLARKYPAEPRADPWAVFFRNARVKRPLVAATLASPLLGRSLAATTQAAAIGADRLGLERLALGLTSLLFDLEFFRGVRDAAGGLGGTLASLRSFRAKLDPGGAPRPGQPSRSPSPAVARSAFNLLLAQVATTALSVGLAAVLARFLGAADFGVFFVVTSMAGLTNVFVEWGQSQYLIREVARRPERAPALLGTSLALRVVFGGAACAAVFATAWLLGYDTRTGQLAALMVAMTLPNVLMQAYAAVFRARDRTDLEAVVTVAAKAVALVATFAVLRTGGRLPAAVLAQGAGAVAALALAWLLARKLALAPLAASRESSRELLAGGAPFASMSLSIGAQSFLDAVVLSKLAPAVVVGWYGAARNVMNTLITPAAILGAASFPRFARESASPSRLASEVRGALRMLLALAALGAVGTYLFADFAVGLIYGIERYRPAATLLRVFALLLPLLFLDVLLGTAASAVHSGRLAAAKLAAIVVATGIGLVAVPLCQQRFGNGGIGLLIGFAAGELIMIGAALRLLPRGILDRAFWLDLARAVLASIATALVVSLVPGLSPLVAIPASVAAFVALSALVGLSRREDLSFVRAAFGTSRKRWADR